MTRFRSWPFLRLHAGAALDPAETGSPLAHRVPRIISIAFLLMLAVGAVAPAWTTPDRSPHNQMIPTSTPIAGPCEPEVSGIIDINTTWYQAYGSMRNSLLVRQISRLGI